MLMRIACLLLGVVSCSASVQATDRQAAPDLFVRGHSPAPAMPRAMPLDIPVDPAGAVRISTPFTTVETPQGPAVVRIPHYQGPDGAYDTPADLTNAINGVPCGVDCTAQSLARWGYRP